MTINWLGTTAVALVIGTGAVIAQSQTDQKREEAPRAQQTPSLPSKDADRPAAGEQRGEAASPSERKQAQEPQPPRDAKQPTKPGREQPSRGERPPTGPQQSQDQQKGRDAKQPTEPEQQQGQQQKQDNQTRETNQPTELKQKQGQQPQPKQDNQARDSRQPADSRQQQGQQQPSQPGRDQAAQPSTPPTQQGARPGDTGQNRQQGQASDRSRPGGTSASATVNEQQRTEIIDRLRRDRSVSNQNINIQVNIGQRLPPRVRARPLPPDIVRIAPQYRGYQYTVVEDEIVVVHPRTREVVDVIREPGSPVKTTSRVERERVLVTREQRETLKQAARRMTTAPVSGSPSGSMSDSSCLALQPVPEELVRANPELGSYRYLAIGEQVVLVDPRQQKIVEVID